MNARIIIVAVSIVVIIGSGFLIKNFFASQKELPKERTKPETINYVTVEPVRYREMETQIEAFGRLASSQTVNLVAEVGGKLLNGSVPLKTGSDFRQGQVLARIYNAEARLNLQSRKSDFLNLVASILPDLKLDFPENYENWKNYFDTFDLNQPLTEIPKFKTSKEKTFLATQNILTQYYSIRSAEENLKKYTIYAPYTGSIAEVSLQVGSVVNPGSQIATLIRTDVLEMEVPIQAEDVRWVETGAEVEIFDDKTNQVWTGTVSRIGDRLDTRTQSVNLYITVNASSNSKLYEGMYLKAVIPGSTLNRSMEIPRSAVFNKDRVYIMKNNKLETRQINIQKTDKDNYIINGLQEGEELVVDAPVNATENMQVKKIKG